MKIAMLIPDNRDEFGDYDEPNPVFGPAPTALLEGMSQEPSLGSASFCENPYVLRVWQITYSFIHCM